MMKAIGIRPSPSEINFTVIDDLGGEVGHSNPQQLTIPREALKGPTLLLFVRTNVLDILNAYNINAACVKEADYHPRAPGNPQRYRIEGVIQEAVASSSADHYISGDVNVLSPHLDLTISEFRNIKNGQSWDQVDDEEWGSYDSKQIESILAAYTAFKSYG
ncbi:hypothetical protein [Fodinibius salsisoli]|uniref:Uncharacterized protein n=1 Tax=Fodinibius salsisoli TaxID=2820877 RepID=A0ABT3PTK2_9BACT|nr:hypothetical protein [Fodinibius salsisoli]MCW9709204.1 hypothetical protein [Fodinibius salsisoli]